MIDRLPWQLLGALAVVAIVAVTVGRCYNDRSSEWEARARAVLAQATMLEEVADSAIAEAERHLERADSLATEAEAAAPEIRERIVTVREETPDSLADEPAVVERDSIIEDLEEESDRWRLAYEEEAERADDLERALEASIRARDSLFTVLDDRPGDRPWWIPRVGVGPHAGIGFDGDAEAGVGVNISWELKI